MNEIEAKDTVKEASKSAANELTNEVSNMKISQETPPPLEGKALTDAIKKQIEFYFSRQNLQNDGFLVSKMNANMEVPISVIAEFAKIRALTKDPNLIVEALKDSKVCVVTQESIKPNFKTERNTIILREIPSDTPVDKVKEIFKGDGFAPITHIRSDVGDTWFVTMATETEAVASVLALRNKQFDGKPIKARLKSENILRSFYPVPTATDAPLPAPAQFPMAPAPLVPPFMQPMMMLNGRPAYFGMHPAAAAQRGLFPGQGGRRNDMGAQGMNQYGMRMGGGLVGGPRTQQAGPRNQQQNPMYVREPRRVRVDSGDATEAMPLCQPLMSPHQQHHQQDHPRGGMKEGGDNRGKGRSDRNKPKGGRDRKQSPRLPPQADFTASDFPALPGQAGPAVRRKPVPKPAGYQGQYQKYDAEDILQIVSALSIEDITVPEGLDLDEHSIAMLKEPNLGLIKNQRTISIDETREVLKQGKPLIRDSVMHGEVDYESLKYGDHHHRLNNNRRTGHSETQHRYSQGYNHHNHGRGHGHAHGHGHGYPHGHGHHTHTHAHGKKGHHAQKKEKKDKEKDDPPGGQPATGADSTEGETKQPKETPPNSNQEESGEKQASARQGAYAAAVMKGGNNTSGAPTPGGAPGGNKKRGASVQKKRGGGPKKDGGKKADPNAKEETGGGGPRKDAKKGGGGAPRKGGGQGRGAGKGKKDEPKDKGASSQKKPEPAKGEEIVTEDKQPPSTAAAAEVSTEKGGTKPSGGGPPRRRGSGGGGKKWGGKKTFVEVLAGGGEASVEEVANQPNASKGGSSSSDAKPTGSQEAVSVDAAEVQQEET